MERLFFYLMENLSIKQKQELLRRFEEVLTPERRQRFDEVWGHRNSCLRLVLENIYQSLNASAIVRTADALGIHHLHIVEDEHPWTINRKISKGALDWLQLENTKSVENTLLSLKSKGFQIAVTDFTPDSISIYDYNPTSPVAVVMGTELTGISETARKMADVSLVIPMMGFTQSLNVSVAAGIVLSQLSPKTRALNDTFPYSEEQRLNAMLHWSKNAIYWSNTIVAQFMSERDKY
jgi:tRNA (guanosine-2'-O-)-methyltransferase